MKSTRIGSIFSIIAVVFIFSCKLRADKSKNSYSESMHEKISMSTNMHFVHFFVDKNDNNLGSCYVRYINNDTTIFDQLYIISVTNHKIDTLLFISSGIINNYTNKVIDTLFHENFYGYSFEKKFKDGIWINIIDKGKKNITENHPIAIGFDGIQKIEVVFL